MQNKEKNRAESKQGSQAVADSSYGKRNVAAAQDQSKVLSNSNSQKPERNSNLSLHSLQTQPKPPI